MERAKQLKALTRNRGIKSQRLEEHDPYRNRSLVLQKLARYRVSRPGSSGPSNKMQ